MTKIRLQPVYVAPKIKIVEIKTRTILCESKQLFGLQNDGKVENGDSEDPWGEL